MNRQQSFSIYMDQRLWTIEDNPHYLKTAPVDELHILLESVGKRGVCVGGYDTQGVLDQEVEKRVRIVEEEIMRREQSK